MSVADFTSGTGGRIPENDPRVETLLAGASAAVRRYCKWHVTPVVDETMVLDWDGADLLVLPTLRLVDLRSVSVSGVSLDLDQVEWSHNGELRIPAGKPGFRSITVTMRHGFDGAEDLVQVVQQIVANALASPLGATREQAGQVSVSWATTAPGVSGGISLLQRDLDILNLYRLPLGGI